MYHIYGLENSATNNQKDSDSGRHEMPLVSRDVQELRTANLSNKLH
jgi:hypothetical protein